MNNLSEWPTPRDAQKKPFPYGRTITTASPFSDIKLSQYASGATSTEGLTILYDKRIDEMQKEIIKLKEMVLSFFEKENDPVKEEIQLRDISFRKAKTEIKKYFQKHHGENIDAAIIQEALGIEISLAMQVCEELENEGQIKEA